MISAEARWRRRCYVGIMLEHFDSLLRSHGEHSINFGVCSDELTRGGGVRPGTADDNRIVALRPNAEHLHQLRVLTLIASDGSYLRTK